MSMMTVIQLSNGDILTIPELFPGWEHPIYDIRLSVFDERGIIGLKDNS